MSRTFSYKKFDDEYMEYIKHGDEPEERTHHDPAEVELDVGLIRFRYFQKRKISRTAKALRFKQKYANYRYVEPVRPVFSPEL
jgi:hypothetical protein